MIETFICEKNITKMLRLSLIPDYYFDGVNIKKPSYKFKDGVYVGLISTNSNISKCGITRKDFTLRDCRFEHSLAIWLLGKRNLIDGLEFRCSIHEIANDLFKQNGKQCKQDDYEKIITNLKFLWFHMFEIIYPRKNRNDIKDEVVTIINELELDKNYVTITLNSMLPKITGDDFDKHSDKYVLIKPKDIYPKMPRHEYFLRQYLLEIIHSGTNEIKGETLLDHSGLSYDIDILNKRKDKGQRNKVLTKYCKIANLEYDLFIESLIDVEDVLKNKFKIIQPKRKKIRS